MRCFLSTPTRVAPWLLLRGGAGALLISLCLGLAACGIAESIAQDIVGDQDVTLPIDTTRSGTLTRQADGTHLLAEADLFRAGDTILGTTQFSVLVINIDRSRQPDRTSLDRAVLRVRVEPDAGDGAALGPLVLAHLDAHPATPIAVADVPDPPGNQLTTIDTVGEARWIEIDVTPAFRQDWDADRAVSAFSLRLATATNGDGQADLLRFESDDGQLRAEIRLTFSVDL